MGLKHQNDPDLVRELLMDPGIWVVVGLSNNRARTAHRISRWMHIELGIPIIPVHPKAETVHGCQGYASIDDIPDQDIKVVDCFVNSERVGAVVDEAAAGRARAAGLDVVMDTCPKIEWPRMRHDGMQR